MENLLHCRFCAEAKGPDKIVNLTENKAVCDEVVVKLRYLNISLSTNQLNLPLTICLVCLHDLNKAWTFVDRYTRSYTVLTEIYSQRSMQSGDVNCQEYNNLEAPPTNINDNLKYDRDALSFPEPTTSGLQKYSVEIMKEEPVEEDPNYSGNESPDFTSMPFLDTNLFVEQIAVETDSISSWKEYKWLCVSCGEQFPDMTVLREHGKSKHSKCHVFTCIDCKEGNHNQFDNLNRFIHHVRQHRTNLRNQCVFCNTECEDISSHNCRKARVFAKLVCSSCGEVLPTKNALVQHTSTYSQAKKRRTPGTPVTEQDLTCDVCHKVYKTLNGLNIHKNNMHRMVRKKECTCEVCGDAFYSNGTLQQHILMKHEKVRPYVCKICNKGFAMRNKLRYHVETHTSLKPFPCEKCGKCFRRKDYLTRHMHTHSDNYPYACQYCSKPFNFKATLVTHERQHTGVKPYTCNDCGMDFTNWSNYNKHMVRRHGTDTSKKKITPEGAFPINPETGKIIEVDEAKCEEWKRDIMVPVKQGKKSKVVKSETDE